VVEKALQKYLDEAEGKTDSSSDKSKTKKEGTK
jgi:hypothetical protein